MRNLVDRRLSLLVLCLLGLPAWAVEPPSLELLEFLSEWQDEDGKWVDPFDVPDSEDGEPAGNDDGEN